MPTYPKLSQEERKRLLSPPQEGINDVVLDTDTYNEVDDQFALAHALLSPERIRLRAIYACPFENRRSESYGDGMEKSYAEILQLLNRMGRPSDGLVHKGARQRLRDPETPVESPAAHDLIARAREPRQRPLFVVGIGAATNLASALIMAPDILPLISLVWLGGHDRGFPHTREFNLMGDPIAAGVLLESGCALVRVPVLFGSSHLLTTVPEMRHYLAGVSPLCDFLLGRFEDYAPAGSEMGWAKELWDVAATAWLIGGEQMMASGIFPAPRLMISSGSEPNLRWEEAAGPRHSIREIIWCRRSAIFADLLRKLGAAGDAGG